MVSELSSPCFFACPVLLFSCRSYEGCQGRLGVMGRRCQSHTRLNLIAPLLNYVQTINQQPRCTSHFNQTATTLLESTSKVTNLR